MTNIILPRSVLEQALEALNASMPHNNDMDGDWPSHIAARRALRAALEQQRVEQSSAVGVIGWKNHLPNSGTVVHWTALMPPLGTKLYTHPQLPRQPLTDEWIRMIYDECDAETGDEFIFAFARDIERAHGITGEQA